MKKEPFDLEESSTESWTTNNEDELNLCEDLFSAVITAADADRPLYPVFQLLPSRKVNIAFPRFSFRKISKLIPLFWAEISAISEILHGYRKSDRFTHNRS